MLNAEDSAMSVDAETTAPVEWICVRANKKGAGSGRYAWDICEAREIMSCDEIIHHFIVVTRWNFNYIPKQIQMLFWKFFSANPIRMRTNGLMMMTIRAIYLVIMNAALIIAL